MRVKLAAVEEQGYQEQAQSEVKSPPPSVLAQLDL